MAEIVAVDVGGTHARFAIAEVQGGRVVALSEPYLLKTSEHAGLAEAWQALASLLGRPPPPAAALAIAAPVEGEVLKFTNSTWVLRPARIPEQLGVDRWTLVNDFGAVGHAVAAVDQAASSTYVDQSARLPTEGLISIVGPGTGLGVAQLLRRSGRNHVIESEGGHIDFAPLDSVEDAILGHLRARYGRVSVERLVSGPGLANIHDALAAIEQRTVRARDQPALWAAALNGEDSFASAALDRFFLSLGSACGDIALAHGASAVVVAGGLGLRLASHLPGSGFAKRFVAKGRYEARMAALPVKILVHPQPGLFGAAAAFAARYP